MSAGLRFYFRYRKKVLSCQVFTTPQSPELSVQFTSLFTVGLLGNLGSLPNGPRYGPRYRFICQTEGPCHHPWRTRRTRLTWKLWTQWTGGSRAQHRWGYMVRTWSEHGRKGRCSLVMPLMQDSSTIKKSVGNIGNEWKWRDSILDLGIRS